MDRSRRREFFWLFLIAGCVALFVARHERPADRYDQRGLTALVTQTQREPVRRRSNDDLETGSIVRPVALPARRPAGQVSYYVPLGSYGSIDEATRRYLDVAQGDPALEQADKLRIETVSTKDSGTFHRVRMGNFTSEKAAKNACSRAGISSSLCLVVAAR